MKPGSYLINTARGKVCEAQAVKEACETGQLAGYAGDVWFPQPVIVAALEGRRNTGGWRCCCELHPRVGCSCCCSGG